MKRLLVVSPHPDDETLGCGGTLLRLVSEGAEAHWLNVTDMSVEFGYELERIKTRNSEIAKVRDALGFSGMTNLGMKPAGLDEYPIGDIVAGISRAIKSFEPDTLFLPFYGDPHSDHRKVFDAAFACTKPFRFPFIKNVIMMEIVSETDHAPALPETAFLPNMFFDISGYLDRKVEILNIYESEVGNHPFPRSVDNVRALALHRGAQSGCEHAEAFMLLKELK